MPGNAAKGVQIVRLVQLIASLSKQGHDFLFDEIEVHVYFDPLHSEAVGA